MLANTTYKSHKRLMITLLLLLVAGCFMGGCASMAPTSDDDTLSPKEFLNPSDPHKMWVYWWWLNGWNDEAGIRADLDHMKAMGISGALVFNAGRGDTPFNTEFLSPRWRELFRYAVEEAALRNIELGLNLCDGWNSGGSWITPELRMTPKRTTSNGGAPAKKEPQLDPLNPAAMDLHFKHIMGLIIDEAGDAWKEQYVGKAFKYTHTDSWERGDPTTTANFAAEFEARRGYKWAEPKDERGREDYDLTRTELFAENYYGRLTSLSKSLGMQTHSEAAGPTQTELRDSLRNFGEQDIVMAEFWSRIPGSNDIWNVNMNMDEGEDLSNHEHLKTAASAAHVYGKKIVQTESYTSWGRPPYCHQNRNFVQSFWGLKDVGDRAFCQGVNRNVLHQMMAQAGSGKKPGYLWRDVGFEFARTNSLWPMGKAWVDYLNRCQYLLQQGKFVGDFLYFHGNRVPVNMPAKYLITPLKPEGTDADLINAHALLTRVSAKNNRITFPDGQSYRYLVLRDGNTDALTPAVLEKLLELVRGGVTLIGSPPERNFGYEGYPASDEVFEKLRAELWSSSSNSGNRKIGLGRVIWGESLEDIMKMDQLAPDLDIVEDSATAALPESVMSGIPGPRFDYIHRKIGKMDAYFVANLRNAKAVGDFTFRVSQGTPQIWNPVDGSIREISDYTTCETGTTKITLNFAERQSFFVVFGSHAKASAVFHNNEMTFKDEIKGAWNVAFDTDWGGPASVKFSGLTDWTKHSDNGIKYYSGTAYYTKTFDLPANLRGSNKPVYLDLGSVKDMAEVTLNGTNLGILWCKPFRLDISSVVKETGNSLKIDVVNRWSNRMLGDEVLNETYTTGNASHAASLIPSGLLGPVKLGHPASVASEK
ncbi:MAG: hypothetical protein DRH90_22350 [Deltaproteobacteria bacterium]|nr:MAG: hypothetical protein DRH90_22350 [Deltaproteobacteria bacterium]